MIFNESEKAFLCLFGWNSFFEEQLSGEIDKTWRPARVICEERNLYRLQFSLDEVRWAAVSGKFQFNTQNRVDFPAVGDWVMAEVPAQSERAVIRHVCNRKSVIERKQVGTTSEGQVLASNVDTVFITAALSRELNYNRIERSLTLVWNSGAVPVLLLTKADLYEEDVADLLADVRAFFPGIAVHGLSRQDFESAHFFADYLVEGTTSVLIGSSGDGKSTIVNFLLGSETAKTQDIREGDGKGRHTTTSRSLYRTRYEGMIIDTPGMRELQLSDHEEGMDIQFADIEALKIQCRFSNCRHLTEPGCAVEQAKMDGSLTEEHWKSYLKLGAEIRHEMRKKDKAIMAQDRKMWKKRKNAV